MISLDAPEPDGRTLGETLAGWGGDGARTGDTDARGLLAASVRHEVQIGESSARQLLASLRNELNELASETE